MSGFRAGNLLRSSGVQARGALPCLPKPTKYLDAERVLTVALETRDAGAATARQDVMLAARQAVDALHHQSDFVLKEPSAALPAFGIVTVGSVPNSSACGWGRRHGHPHKPFGSK